MKVLRAAVVLGLSTPLVVLACGSDDGRTVISNGGAGDGGDASAGTSGASGSAGETNGGASSPGGAGPDASGAGGGSTDAGGAGGVGGVGGEASGGAGGEANPPASCGDGAIDGGLVCFDAAEPLVVGEGSLTDVAIGVWNAEQGSNVLAVSGSGLVSFAYDPASGPTTPTYLGTSGAVLGVGQLDAGADLDVLLGQANSGATIATFGDGTGAIATSVTSNFQSEGVLFNYFVADVAGSGASADIVATFANSISLVLTTGTEGEGFEGPIASAYPGSPLDGVLATLGSSQWLVYTTAESVYRQRVTIDAVSVTLGAASPTSPGGSPAALDVGDFNEDGFDDVVATLTDAGSLSVLFGDGLGAGDFVSVALDEQFLSLTIGDTDAAKTQRDVKVGDFNGDGHADVAVSVHGLDAVAIFSGDGEGAFGEPELVSTGVGSGPTRLAAGDLNADGIDDLAVVATTISRLILLLSDP